MKYNKKKRRRLSWYIKRYKGDLSNINLTGVSFVGYDLRDTILPKDKNLFQKIKNKSLFKVLLPSLDLREYNFKDVNLVACTFTPDTLLPSNNKLFLEVLNMDLFGAILPKINLNDYIFEGVKIANTIFTRNTIMTTDKDFFQKVYNKSLYYTVLPLGDYSNFDFTDVCVIGTDFQSDSSVVGNSSLIFNIRQKSLLNTVLPKNIIDSLLLYNLDGVEMDLTCHHIDAFKALPFAQLKNFGSIKMNPKLTIKRKSVTFKK